jgi:hypothetical protein
VGGNVGAAVGVEDVGTKDGDEEGIKDGKDDTVVG